MHCQNPHPGLSEVFPPPPSPNNRTTNYQGLTSSCITKIIYNLWQFIRSKRTEKLKLKFKSRDSRINTYQTKIHAPGYNNRSTTKWIFPVTISFSELLQKDDERSWLNESMNQFQLHFDLSPP